MLRQESLQDRLGFPIPLVDAAPEGVGKTTRCHPITEASIPNNAGVNSRGPLQNPETLTPMKLTHRWPRFGKNWYLYAKSHSNNTWFTMGEGAEGGSTLVFLNPKYSATCFFLKKTISTTRKWGLYLRSFLKTSLNKKLHNRHFVLSPWPVWNPPRPVG